MLCKPVPSHALDHTNGEYRIAIYHSAPLASDNAIQH